jgi:hypothetical protein
MDGHRHRSPLDRWSGGRWKFAYVTRRNVRRFPGANPVQLQYRPNTDPPEFPCRSTN